MDPPDESTGPSELGHGGQYSRAHVSRRSPSHSAVTRAGSETISQRELVRGNSICTRYISPRSVGPPVAPSVVNHAPPRSCTAPSEGSTYPQRGLDAAR